MGKVYKNSVYICTMQQEALGLCFGSFCASHHSHVTSTLFESIIVEVLIADGAVGIHNYVSARSFVSC